jgi:hypothetical protein
VDWLVKANVSEKRTVSIFRAEVSMLKDFPSCRTKIPLIPSIITSALKMETVRFSETLAFTSQSTRRLNL